jgi:hypothetical protein
MDTTSGVFKIKTGFYRALAHAPQIDVSTVSTKYMVLPWVMLIGCV